MVVLCIRVRSWFSVVASYKCRRVRLRLSGLYDSSCSARSFVASSCSLVVVLPCLVPDFTVCSFVHFPSILLVWSVASSVRRLISVVSFLVASGSRSLRNPICVPNMSDNADEVTPVSSSPSAPMSGVTAAQASSVQPVAASADPTMGALFDIVRARSSASVAPPPDPVSTPSGYFSFTGTVRRSIGVDTRDPEGVIGDPASSDRLLTSILQRTDWVLVGRPPGESAKRDRPYSSGRGVRRGEF